MSSAIRILLVGPCRFFQDTLRVALIGQDRLALSAATSNLDEAAALLEKSVANVVVVSGDALDGYASDVIQRIKAKFPTLSVIVLNHRA